MMTNTKHCEDMICIELLIVVNKVQR